MKKIYLFIISLLSLTTVYAIHTYHKIDRLLYINENDVLIHESVYDKMILIGLDQREINSLNQEEYDKYMGMIITHTSKTSTSESFIEINNQKSDGSNASSSVTHLNRTLVTTGTWYKTDGYNDELLIKVTVTWSSPPRNRDIDIIGIGFANTVQARPIIIDGSQRPDFSSKLFYTEEYYHTYNDDSLSTPLKTHYFKNHEVLIDGRHTDSYNYSLDHDLEVMHVLPKNLSHSRYEHGADYLNGVSERYRVFTDFSYTLEARFTPKLSDLNSVSFTGFFRHKKGGLFSSFDETTYGHITLS